MMIRVRVVAGAKRNEVKEERRQKIRLSRLKIRINREREGKIGINRER